MKLTDTYSRSMKEIIEDCDIVNQKIHTDDDGNIEAIEIKYKPKDTKGKCGDVKIPSFMNTGGH